MNQYELTDLGFTLAEIVRGIGRGSVGGHDKHVVDSMRHFLAGVAATQPSSDDCDLIASEAVRQMSIALHAGASGSGILERIPAPSSNQVRRPPARTRYRCRRPCPRSRDQ